MDKPLVYGTSLRGSSPRGEAIIMSLWGRHYEYLYKGGNCMLPVSVIKWTKATAYDLRSFKECEFDEMHEDALVRELVANGYIICGDTHQSPEHPCVPIFNDGYVILSMRRWAEIMEQAWVAMDPYHHMDNWFYMTSTCSVEEKLPECSAE